MSRVATIMLGVLAMGTTIDSGALGLLNGLLSRAVKGLFEGSSAMPESGRRSIGMGATTSMVLTVRWAGSSEASMIPVSGTAAAGTPPHGTILHFFHSAWAKA